MSEGEQPQNSEQPDETENHENVTNEAGEDSTNDNDNQQSKPTDQFGRTIRPSETEEGNKEPQVQFPPKRPLIDAETDLAYVLTLSPENTKNANQIAKVIAVAGNPSSRLTQKEIFDMATRLFTDYSKHIELLLQMLICSILRMSPQVESLAALFGIYCERFYSTYEDNLIQKVIPEALQDAFSKDHFRVVKLLLRFLGAFVSYKLVTQESFIKLLSNLADMIPKATPCRGENLSRAIIVACKTAPACINQEDLDPIYQKIGKFIETRPNNFIQRFSPFKDNNVSFLDYLYKSEPLQNFTEAYTPLFSKGDTSKAKTIPDIEFTFGEVDRAPFPFVVLPVEEVTAGFDPVLADIADDILVFYGDDANLTADQMLALPMLLNYKSLKLADKGDKSDGSHFIIPLFNSIILSDVLRIPSSYYKPAFHACVFMNLIEMLYDSHIIQTNLSPVILNLVNDISSLDTGCYFRFVRFFSHYVSLYRFSWVWNRWAGFSQFAENDMRLLFLRDVISHCYYFGNPDSVIKILKDNFSSILPPKPEKFEIESEERSDKLREALKSVSTDGVDSVKESYEDIVSVSGDFTALKTLITNIFDMGDGDSGKTLRKIEEFGQIIKHYFNEDWKKKLIITSAFEFFSLMPPVLEQLIVYLISNEFCETSNFLSFFFDKTSNVVKIPESWELFNIIMESLVSKSLAEGNNNEAQDIVRKVFVTTSEFYKTKSQRSFDPVSERFIVGNLKEFGRNHYDIFASIDSEMNGLIASGDVDNDFRDIIQTISSFGSE